MSLIIPNLLPETKLFGMYSSKTSIDSPGAMYWGNPIYAASYLNNVASPIKFKILAFPIDPLTILDISLWFSTPTITVSASSQLQYNYSTNTTTISNFPLIPIVNSTYYSTGGSPYIGFTIDLFYFQQLSTLPSYSISSISFNPNKSVNVIAYWSNDDSYIPPNKLEFYFDLSYGSKLFFSVPNASTNLISYPSQLF